MTYVVDLNQVTWRCYKGEDAALPFRSKLTKVTNRILSDYYFQGWMSGQLGDFTPAYDFNIRVDSDDMTLGYIDVNGNTTFNTRDNQIFIQVYGISKTDNSRIMLFNGLLELMG